MKKLIRTILLLSLAFYYLSCTSNCLFKDPDLQKFNSLVSSKSIQDSLKHKIITVGMPYFVIEDVFTDCKRERGIPVASIGSQQELLESEGLGRVYHNPSLKTYLDIYNTSKGVLKIWYGYFTFYSLEVERNDLILFYNKETIDTAKILYLIEPGRLRIDKNLNYDLIQYSEIHHKEQTGKVTFWYDVSIMDSNVVLNPGGMDYYPIYRMELDNKEVKSFHLK